MFTPQQARHLSPREWVHYARLGLIEGVDAETIRAQLSPEYTAIG